ncbi:MAG: hypothetical protein QOH23_86 [Gaiellaceae bacterium]|jgi:hypothetical protein|nr:hypothetical protein [Gaiellaceae bacterium]
MRPLWFVPVVALAMLAAAAPAQARHAPRGPQPQTPQAMLIRAQALARSSTPVRAVANANPATFTDTASDGGTAPDILTVITSNDASGTFTFRINVDKLTLPSNVLVFLAMDTDGNPATGTGGFDYILICDESNDSVGLLRWDGSQLVAALAPSLGASDNSTGITASVNRIDLGNASALNFEVLTVEGASPTAGHFDAAPDDGVWNYQLAAAAPLTLKVASFASPRNVKAGKTFKVTMAVSRSDSGASVNDEIGGSLSCQASAAGKRLALVRSGFVEGSDPELAACVWRAPKKRGKTIRGSISVSVEGVTAKKTFKLVVK